MTKFESKKKKPDWDSLSQWEDTNKALVMWVITPECIYERMEETGIKFSVSKDLVKEFCYHTRREWDMEAFKNAFKDFVIEKLQDEVKYSDPMNFIT